METRKSLLEATQNGENPTTALSNLLTKDVKTLKKAKRDIDDQLEEAEEELLERLSSPTPLDKAVVEITFNKVKGLQEKLELYNEFENTYFPKEQQ